MYEIYTPVHTELCCVEHLEQYTLSSAVCNIYSTRLLYKALVSPAGNFSEENYNFFKRSNFTWLRYVECYILIRYNAYVLKTIK